MSGLTSFLLARIAEDEAVAREAGPDGGEWSSRYSDDPTCHMFGDYGWLVSGPGVEVEDSDWGKALADHIARHDPARVLAECEAKRRIVEELAIPYIAERRRLMNGQPSWGDEHPELLLWLALPYADHPDYREEWRP